MASVDYSAAFYRHYARQYAQVSHEFRQSVYLRRRELAWQIQRRVLEGAYRHMPATRTSIWAWWPRVQGFHPNFAAFEYAHWSKVWLTE